MLKKLKTAFLAAIKKATGGAEPAPPTKPKDFDDLPPKIRAAFKPTWSRDEI
jgi:hypothetical protein